MEYLFSFVFVFSFVFFLFFFFLFVALVTVFLHHLYFLGVDRVLLVFWPFLSAESVVLVINSLFVSQVELVQFD